MRRNTTIKLLFAVLLIAGLLPFLGGITAQASEGDIFAADTAEGVTVQYKVLTENTSGSSGTVQVGTGLAGQTAISSTYTGTVTIPATVENGGITYTVVEVAYKAMFDCRLTGVNLPNTISSIGGYAFNATGLTHIELPLSLSRINGYAFSNCGGLTSVNLPEGVTFLGVSAFTACANLADAALPDSLTELPDYLFKDCTSLSRVSLGSEVQGIGYQTFYGCSALTEITLPASLAEIRSDAFRNCTSLADVYFEGDCPTLSGSDHFVGVASPAYANVYESAANFPFEGQDLYGLTIRYMDDNAQRPLISAEPQDKTVRTGNVASLTVNASVLDGGVLSFQWYSHTVKQNTGGTLIPGATNFTYMLPTSVAGSYYYYVEVTNTNTSVSGSQTATTVSYPATVTVYDATDAETPVITSQPADATANQGTIVTLSVSVIPLSDGGTLSYAWYENTVESYSGGVFVGEESSVIAPYLGVRYYYVIVTNTNNSVSGTKTASVTSDIARVTINSLINAQAPEINVQPQNQGVSVGGSATLSVDAVSLDGGELTYQWYVNNNPSTVGALELPGATESSYSPSTEVFGANYYFAVITNTNNDLSGVKSAQITSDIAEVNVGNTSYAITVENDGHGTAGANPNPAVLGQTVQLGYLADSGYRFKEWQVISGSINIQPDNTFMMPASAVTVKAIFEDIPDYTITVSDDGHGEGRADPAAADAGATVTISAINYSGYVFKEWQVISGAVTLASTTATTTTFTMPAGNVEVKAVFEAVMPGQYTLNMQSSAGGTAACDGGSSNIYAQNAPVNLFTTPDSGYVFKEWELISGTYDVSNITKLGDNWYNFMMPESNLVLKAVFEPAEPGTYTITINFNANGGSGAMNQQTVTGGVAQTLNANTLTYNGHAFAGWATSPTGSVVYSDGQEVTFLADTTLYAVWRELETYTVTFDANGGSGTIANQIFIEGEAKTLNANTFTRTDYTFSGWATSPSGNVVYSDGQNVTMTEDTTLYAVWGEPATYTVTFDANGGSGTMSDQIFTEGVAQALTANTFTLTDYSFSGWATSPTGSVVYSDGQSVTMTANTDLYAVWSEPATYTVTFDANEGSGSMDDQIFTEGVPQALTANAFTREGYFFHGWAPYWSGNSMQYTDGQTVTVEENLTFYAKWIPEGTTEYTVTFDANGGEGVMNSQIFWDGYSQNLIPNTFTRTGFNFTGWALTPTSSVWYEDCQNAIVGGDITLYALWEEDGPPPATYDVTVEDDGHGTGSADPNPAAEGETVTLSYNPDSGYRFQEWQVISGGVIISGNTFSMPANDVTVKALFEEIPVVTYDVTVEDDGNGTGSADPNPAAEGETVTLSYNPDSGYRFQEWQVISGGVIISGNTFSMPANDVTVKALFEEIPVVTYDVTVEDDGNGTGSADPNPAAEGETVTLSYNPDSGYRFQEWQAISGGVIISGNTFSMPANDVTVKALFEEIPVVTYDITVEDDGHGTGSADPNPAAEGETVTLSYNPDSGYRFQEWQVISGGVIISGNTFSMPANDVTVRAVFEEIPVVTYDVTVEDDGHGTGSADPNPAAEGETVTLSYNPDSGYRFQEWEVISGGVSISGNTFSMPANDVTVRAIFEEQEITGGIYTVFFDPNRGTCSTASALTDINGRLTSLPSAKRSNYKFSGWFTAPSGGRKITIATVFTSDTMVFAHWTRKGSSTGDGGSSESVYRIVATAGPGGAISPAGTISVIQGRDETFAIKADTGYVISDVLVDGISLGAVDKYTFQNVKANHTISPVFKKIIILADVQENDWFYDEVLYVMENEIMTGTAEGWFSPDLPTSRAMLVTILFRLENEPAVSGPWFTDVPDNMWYSQAIRWATANGIVSGYGGGRFGPNDSITREQAAAILYNYARYKGYDVTKTTDLDSFSDAVQISAWASEAMRWAVGSKLMAGKEEGLLDPGGISTRAEIAALITQFHKMYNQ